MLDISNLEVIYNRIARVLNGVSLSVGESETVALLGPNGAGKSTLLRAITGLLALHEGDITKGQIRFSGTPLTGRSADAIVREGVVQVMEGRRIFVDLTVEDNLRAGAHTRRDDRIAADIDEFYTLFPPLAERRHQLAGYLSGGEQQMLAIARAMMAQPKLLLLDEPSLGLSPRLTGEIAALIRRIQERGISILLVEQNAAMALNLAHRGYVLESGKIVIDGPAAELAADEDVREFYLGHSQGARRDFSQVKHYRRRRRWLS